MAKRRYRNAPIEEAVCEFRFEPGSEWDLALPGLMYEKLRGTFPERGQARRFAGHIEAGPETIEQKIIQKDHVRFTSKDKQRAVIVGAHFLSASVFRPYSSWESFRPIIRHALKVYRGVATPKGIQRIGLRYNNNFEISSKDSRVMLEDHFDFYPFLGAKLPVEHGSFYVAVEMRYENNRDILRLQLSNTPSETPDSLRFNLDLDYFCGRAGAIEFHDVTKWLTKAHKQIGATFEGCIKNSLRDQFEELH